MVFLVETKAGLSRIKGLQKKLECTQGIVVLSDGRSEGLAMLWREGKKVTFKSCSHSHIDVVVCEEENGKNWRVIGFYGHPDARIRFSSCELIKMLHAQASLPLVIFGDFNDSSSL